MGKEQILKEVEAEEENGTNEETEILVDSTQDDIKSAFNSIVHPKAVTNAKVFEKRKKKERRVVKDNENFIGYQSKDHHSEAGYSMMSGFEAEASKAVLDLTGDDGCLMKKKKTLMRWDAKKKKYVKADAGEDSKKKIKTESGVWIPASYKTDRYAKWRERSKLTQMQEAEEAANSDQEESGHSNKKGQKRQTQYSGLPAGHPAMKKAKMAVPVHKKGPRNELKKPEQILKQRKMQAKNTIKQKKKSKGGGGRKR